MYVNFFDSMTDEPVMFEKELDTDTIFDNPNEAFYVEKDDKGVYVVSITKNRQNAWIY